MRLEVGGTDKAKIVARGRGVKPPPPPLPLSADTQVTAQVVNPDGECWESVFASTTVGKNTANKFKAKYR